MKYKILALINIFYLLGALEVPVNDFVLVEVVHPRCNLLRPLNQFFRRNLQPQNLFLHFFRTSAIFVLLFLSYFSSHHDSRHSEL